MPVEWSFTGAHIRPMFGFIAVRVFVPLDSSETLLIIHCIFLYVQVGNWTMREKKELTQPEALFKYCFNVAYRF